MVNADDTWFVKITKYNFIILSLWRTRKRSQNVASLNSSMIGSYLDQDAFVLFSKPTITRIISFKEFCKIELKNKIN